MRFNFCLKGLAAFVFLTASEGKAATMTQVFFNDLTPSVTGSGSIAYRGDSMSAVEVNTVEGFGLTAIAGGNPLVMRIPSFSPSQGFHFDTGITLGNGDGYYTNQYTMVFDLYWAETVPYFSFYNAEGYNDNDGDFFRRGSDLAIGVGNDGYFGSAANNQWHRVAFTVTNTDASTTTISIYLNGVYLGDSVRVGGTDGRFSLYLAGENGTALFTDNNQETGPAYLSQFYFTDEVLSAEQIAALGGASAHAIPEPSLSAIVGLGLLGLGVWRKRYSRRERSATHSG